MALGEACCCFFCVAVIVTIATVLGTGFHKIEANTVAFDYDGNSLTVDRSNAYTSAGLEFIGPGHYFIKYTTLEQTVDFDNLVGRTYDGLQVGVTFQFQYVYDTSKDSLLNLYDSFGTRRPKEKKAFKRVAQTAALDALGKYTAYDVKQKQETVASTLESFINQRLKEHFGATVNSLQLSDVVLPDAINDAITDTLTVEQNVIAAGNQQDTARVTAQTDVYNAELDAEVTIYTAETTASAMITTANAEASAIRTTLEAEADAYLVMYKSLQNHFPEFNQTDMVNYIWLESLQDAQSTSVVFDVDTPAAIY